MGGLLSHEEEVPYRSNINYTFPSKTHPSSRYSQPRDEFPEYPSSGYNESKNVDYDYLSWENSPPINLDSNNYFYSNYSNERRPEQSEFRQTQHLNTRVAKQATSKPTTELNNNQGRGSFRSSSNITNKRCTTLTPVAALPIIENHFFRYATRNWTPESARNICTYVKLSEYSEEYLTIRRKIKSTAPSLIQKHIVIKSVTVERVQNPYLFYLYLLKKAELKTMFPVTERNFFHGCSMANVDQICRENLDFRRCERGKFGKGVSFSKNFSYAFHYADKKSKEKIVLLCKVLVSNAHIGNDSYTIPLAGYDTTMKENKEVFVKYDDDVFYPEYKLTIKIK